MTDNNNDKKTEETLNRVEGLLASMTFETRDQLRERFYGVIDAQVNDTDPVVRVIGRDFCVRQVRALIDQELSHYDETTGALDRYAYNALMQSIANAVLVPLHRAQDEIKAEHSRMSVRVLNQIPEDRALWVWTQAMQAVLPHFLRDPENAWTTAADCAAATADHMLEEARKRFGSIL